MKKFGEYLEESLAAEVKSEPKTAAAKEARKLGLTYMGFGRYANSKGEISYLVDKDKLVPYKSRDEIDSMYYKQKTSPKKISTSAKNAGKNVQQEPDWQFYNNALNKREVEDSKILRQKGKEAEATHRELTKFYKEGMFSQDEFDAIVDYTGEGFGPVNRYLYKGHDPEVTPEQDEYINSMIENLDSAFEETQAPFPYTVYTGLSERYSADKIKPGSEYIFRGYLSTSVSFDVSITSFTDGTMSSKNPVVLQIEVGKGQKSIYVDALSQHQGEMETMLPRGSKIKIVSGPHIMDYSIMNPGADPMKIALFHCVLVEDE